MAQTNFPPKDVVEEEGRYTQKKQIKNNLTRFRKNYFNYGLRENFL